MTERDCVIDEAFNLAVAHIQRHLGVTDGGFASMWFCGAPEEQVCNLLGAYYDAEERFSEGDPS